MASGQFGAGLRDLGRIFGSGTASGLRDSELLERFAADRDEAAFAALVARHGPMVLATCRGVLRSAQDAEDAFQATFLILARKAGSIRVAGSLGGWLHRTARRVAVQASVDLSRRRRRERASGAPEPRRPGPWDDLIPLLHEEIGRLPEKYRVPIVLCDLGAMTRDEAAGQLGWPPGTVAGRLARGRKLLHDRLTRRGAAPASTLLAAIPRATVPESWAEAAIKAAIGKPGKVAAGASSASTTAVLWCERTLRAMFLTKLKTIGALVLATAAASGLLAAGLKPRAVGQAPAANPPKPPAAPKPTPAQDPAPQAEPALIEAIPRATDVFDEVVLQGRVIDPDGKPFAGAKIYWFGREAPSSRPPGVRATSDADGRFRFTASTPKRPTTATLADGRVVTLLPSPETAGFVASAEGYGLGFFDGVEEVDALGPILKLARDDVPIAGRVLDIEGRPVVGATVRGLEVLVPNVNAFPETRVLKPGEAAPRMVVVSKNPSLDPWLDALKNGRDRDEKDRAHFNLMATMMPPGREDAFSAIVPPASTDTEGRFRITGVGRERVLMAMIEGPSIESRVVWIATRRGPTLRVEGYPQEMKKMMGPNAPDDAIIHGATFDHVAGPGRMAEGVVRDLATGRPLSGVLIRSDRRTFLDRDGHGSRATTDEQGRYRLPGLTDGSTATVEALPPVDSPYPGMDRTLEVGRGPGPATLDFPLRRGVVVTGRVIDRATGRPAAGARLDYYAFLDNPNTPRYPDRMAAGNPVMPASSDAAGRFRIVAYPGPGLVAATVFGLDYYVRGAGAEAIVGKRQNGMFLTNPGLLPQNCSAVVAIDPPPGADSMTVDLFLEAGRDRAGTVLDPDGKPLAGSKIVGLAEMSSTTLKSSEFKVTGLAPGRPRKVVVRHDGRKLIGTLVVDRPEGPPLAIRLGPWGSVSGRVVDDDGNPRRGTFVLQSKADWPPHAKGEVRPEPPKNRFEADGLFRIEGLIPGESYNLDLGWESPGKRGRLLEGLVVKPGEDRDLGDLKVKPFN